MKAKLFIWTILVSAPILVWSQTAAWQDPGYDTNYVTSFRDYFVITLVAANTNNAIGVTDTLGNDIMFNTNLPFGFGIALDYRWFTLEYTNTLGRTGEPNKGETIMNSLGFGLTGRKFWFRNFYQKTKGYYLDNPTYFNPDFNPAVDSYPSRSDVSSTLYYANLNYGFNHRRFSNMAALWQLERQKKSAGSFTAGLTFSVAKYNADSALVPSAFQDYFEGRDFITDFRFGMVGVNGGYLHTFSLFKSRKFFISLALIPGISYQRGETYSSQTGAREKNYAFGAHAEGRFVLGYNGSRWYSSISSVAYAVSSRFSETNPFSQGYSFFRLVVGYKFLMPEHNIKFLKKYGL